MDDDGIADGTEVGGSVFIDVDGFDIDVYDTCHLGRGEKEIVFVIVTVARGL